MSYSFGGKAPVVAPLRAALQLDHRLSAGDAPLPPVFRLDLDGASGNLIRVAGLPVARPATTLGQAEDRGLFDFVDFDFANYTATDWGMLGASVVAVGFAADAALSDDDPAATGGNGGGGGGGGDDGGGEICVEDPICIPDPTGGLPYSATAAGIGHGGMDADYRRWLDGGTGQMGDLR